MTDPDPVAELQSLRERLAAAEKTNATLRQGLIETTAEREVLRAGGPPTALSRMLGLAALEGADVAVSERGTINGGIEVRITPRHDDGSPMLVADPERRGHQRPATVRDWLNEHLREPENYPLADALLWHPDHRPPGMGRDPKGVPYAIRPAAAYLPPEE